MASAQCTMSPLYNTFRRPIELSDQASLGSGILAVDFKRVLRLWRSPTDLARSGLGEGFGGVINLDIPGDGCDGRQDQGWWKLYLLHVALHKVVFHKLKWWQFIRNYQLVTEDIFFNLKLHKVVFSFSSKLKIIHNDNEIECVGWK